MLCNTMFPHNPKRRMAIAYSESSSESKEMNDNVEGDQVMSTAKTPDCDSKHFAHARSSSVKKKVFRHNVEYTSSEIEDCDLKEFRQRYRIPNCVKMFVPKLGETADNPPKGCVAVYMIMLKNGLRLPANDFVNKILATIGLAPAQVTHNSWVILTAFQVACHVAGVKPSVELFKTMYKINYFNKDYIYFSQRENKNLTLLNLAKKIKWEPYFFFVTVNAFAANVPRHFCYRKTIDFKCTQSDIEMQYSDFRKKFPQRLLFAAYLDEKVIVRCNIYKDAIKRPKEDAYGLLLKAHDALVKTAIAKNDQHVLKLIKEENLRTGKLATVDASDVSVEFKPSEQDSIVAPVISSAISLGNGSASLDTKKSSVLDADGDQDVEIIDVEKFMFSTKKPLSSTNCSLPASAWPKTSAGKTQVDRIHKSIAPHPKKKRTSLKIVLNQVNDAVEDEEHMQKDQMPIKEQKRELLKDSAPETSGLKDEDELDSISVQLDAILEKGAQSLQETSDHRNQMTNILASLEYCHLGASLEKAAQQVSNLRDQVALLRSRHAKLETCLKNYNQEVSDLKNSIEVLNSVRAQLQTFGLKESPEEVAHLENQVVQLNSIHAHLEKSMKRCAQLEASLKMSEQEVSIMDDQVKRLVQNHRSTQEHSQLQLKSLKTEFDQLEGSIKKTDQDVGNLIIIVRHMTTILAQLVEDVEQANDAHKVSSASTKSLYEKAKRQCLRQSLAEQESCKK